MTMWQITKESPSRYTVRTILIIGGIGAVNWGKADAPSLQAAHKLIPEGAECVPRAPDDDPRIVETWKTA